MLTAKDDIYVSIVIYLRNIYHLICIETQKKY